MPKKLKIYFRKFGKYDTKRNIYLLRSSKTFAKIVQLTLTALKFPSFISCKKFPTKYLEKQ